VLFNLTRRNLLAGAAALAATPALVAAQEGGPASEPGSITFYSGFASKHVLARDVAVWLPDEKFRSGPLPVIYAHDGGNLFDPATSYSGTAWELDRTSSELAEQGLGAAMVVAISSSPERSREYNSETIASYLPEHTRTMLDASCGGSLKSAAYLRFIVEELKPFIDANFDTKPDRNNTFMLGSSMGGIVAIEALGTHPDVFGAAAALSAHMFLIGPDSQAEGFVIPEDSTQRLIEAVTRFGEEALPEPGAHRLWMDRGTVDLDAFYGDTQVALTAALIRRGYSPGRDFRSRVFAGTGHFETWWQQRSAEVLTFLLTPTA
jgi:enterochelin esterase-like enzyme